MCNKLQDNLNAILLDKETNLLPENLKKGVKLLGIEGTFEGGNNSPIKVYDSEEAMKADESTMIGDIALIQTYTEHAASAGELSSMTYLHFPDSFEFTSPSTPYQSLELNYYTRIDLLGDKVEEYINNGMYNGQIYTITSLGDSKYKAERTSQYPEYYYCPATSISYSENSIKCDFYSYIGLIQSTFGGIFIKNSSGWQVYKNQLTTNTTNWKKGTTLFGGNGLQEGTLDLAKKLNIATVKSYIDSADPKIMYLNKTDLPSLGDGRYFITKIDIPEAFTMQYLCVFFSDPDAYISGFSTDGTQVGLDIHKTDDSTMINYIGTLYTEDNSASALLNLGTVTKTEAINNLFMYGTNSYPIYSNMKLVSADGTIIQEAGPKASTTLRGEYYTNILGERIEGTLENTSRSNIKLFNSIDDMKADEDKQLDDIAILYDYTEIEITDEITVNGFILPKELPTSLITASDQQIFTGGLNGGDILKINSDGTITLDIESTDGGGGTTITLYTKSDNKLLRDNTITEYFSFSDYRVNMMGISSAAQWVGTSTLQISDTSNSIWNYIKPVTYDYFNVYQVKDGSYNMLPTYLTTLPSHIVKGRTAITASGKTTGTLDLSAYSNKKVKFSSPIKGYNLDTKTYTNEVHTVVLDKDFNYELGDKRFVIFATSPMGPGDSGYDVLGIYNDPDTVLQSTDNGSNFTLIPDKIYKTQAGCITYLGISLESIKNMAPVTELIDNTEEFYIYGNPMYIYTNCKVLDKDGNVLKEADPKADTTIKGNYYINIFGEKVEGTAETSAGSSDEYNLKAKILYSGGSSIGAYITKIGDVDISNVTSMNSLFYGCNNLLEIPEWNTENVTDMGNMFYQCWALTSIPLLNTSKVTSMAGMFKNCTHLITIPELDTSSLKGMNTAFENCSELSDESLNNILAMCTKAVNYTQNKRLINIGLTKSQATKCTTLSNYSDFIDAGWTTGY